MIHHQSRTLLTVLVHSNLIIATAAVGVSLTTIALLEYPLEWLPLAFVFVATLLIYTMNRFTDLPEDHSNLPGRVAFIRGYGFTLLAIASVAYCGLLIMIFLLVPRMLILAILPPIIAWLYGMTRVTEYLLVKNCFVGVGWALIPTGLGLYYGDVLTLENVLVIGFVFAYLSIAALVFDIKDIVGDQQVGTVTLPVRIGYERTKYIALVLLVGLVPLVLLAAIVIASQLLIFALYSLYLGVIVPFAGPERGPLYYGVLIDSEHILIGLIASVLWLV